MLRIMLAVISLLFLVQTSHADDTIRFGVFPFLPPNRLEASFGPLTKTLENFFGKPVSFRTRKSFPDFLRALGEESFDIAVVQPFDYVRVRDAVAYLPVVRRTDPLRAAVVVKEEAILKLTDLRGKVIAFPSPYAAVTLLGQQYLADSGIIENEFTAKFYPEHDSCTQAVLTGNAQACITASGVVKNQQALRDLSLRSIGESSSIPSVLFVLHPNLMEYRHDLAELLIGLKNSESGRKILAQSLMLELTEAKAAEYDAVSEYFRALNQDENAHAQ